MSSVTIKKVSSRKDLERFIDFHYDLYEGCEQDVPNLFSDEMNTLDKRRTPRSSSARQNTSWPSMKTGAWQDALRPS